MPKSKIIELRENGEAIFPRTHADAIEGLSDFIWSSRASIIFRTRENIMGSLAEQKEQGGQIFS